jgi:predicted enzyme related to lactoylglutathione lyase
MADKVNYFEIGSPDPTVTATFYGSLFNWEIEAPTGPAPYSMVDGGNGGVWDTSGIGGTSWAIFYVQVDDVRAAMETAEGLGATVAVPFTDNGGIEFAHLLDPLGNRFGIWRPKE